MNKFFITAGKFSLSLIGLIFLVASATAQVTLRKGLDFDADGKADYVLFSPSSSTIKVKRSSDDGNQSKTLSFSFSTRDYFTPGDYDGDGTADYSVWRNSDGKWYQFRSTASAFVAIPYGASSDEPVARDYDGDGIADFAIVKRIAPTTAAPGGKLNWNYFRSSNSTYATFDFCEYVDLPVPGDYDGDGKFDLACYRPGANVRADSNFFIMPSTTPPGQSPGYWYQATFGKGGDQVVSGDYDGDTKTDLALVRDGVTSSHGLTWYIKRSSDNVLTTVNFGLTGTDRPVQADYDGDGKTDIAIWRQRHLDRGFWIQRSSTNVIYTKNFGDAGDIPLAHYDTH